MINPDQDNISNEIGAENERDESDILANQDETDIGSTSRDDLKMGAGSTGLLEDEDFVDEQGHELDVKDQMDRAMRTRAATDRANPKWQAVTSEDEPADYDDGDQLISSNPADNAKFKSAKHGSSTGAFTDIGAGRSGVTKHH